MMKKNKSRFHAKLKALVVIPAAILAFFLFAHLTVKSPSLTFSNFNTKTTSNLNGIWENTDKNSFGRLIHFSQNLMSILESEDKALVVETPINIKAGVIEPLSKAYMGEQIRYEISGSELKIWWNKSESTLYRKTDYRNSFEALTPRAHAKFSLPSMQHTKILEKQNYLYSIYVHENKYYVDNKECSLNTLSNTIESRLNQFNVLDKPYVTTRLVVDENTTMEHIWPVYQALRELRLYKIAYGAFPQKPGSILHYHASGIAQMLPPSEKDGAVLMNEEELGDKLIVLTPSKNSEKEKLAFKNFILSHPKYVASYKWNNKTKYGDYVAVIDMAYDVIYELRDNYAQKEFGMNYSQLPKTQQKEIRKVYPMRISQVNTDEE